MRVLGLDLSLTGSAAAYDVEGEAGTLLFDPAPRRGMDRILWIREHLINTVVGEGIELAVIEDYAFSRAAAHAHELGELGGVVKATFLDNGISYALVLPNQLKMYALGKGGGKGTDKAAMRIAAYKRFGREFPDDNCCDAFWLYTMGLDAMGEGTMIADLPPSHRKVLSDIAWPGRPAVSA